MFRLSVAASWQLLNLALFTIMIGVTLVAIVTYERSSRQRSLAAAQLSVAQRARTLRATLENLIHEKIHTVDALAILISVDQNLTQEKYTALATNLVGTDHSMKNIAAAPNFVIKYVYPLKGNEAAIGLDLQKTQALQSPSKYMENGGSSIFAGPIELVQGAQAFIVRAPVIRFDPATGNGHLWGVISAAFDATIFYRDSGIIPQYQDLDIALRNVDEGGHPEVVFYGSAAVFEDAPIIEIVNLLTGRWQIAVIPKGGWNTHNYTYAASRYLFGFAGVIFLGLLIFSSRQAQVKQQAKSVLGAALEAIEDGFALYDPKDRLVAYNSRYADIYARSKKALFLGNSFEKIMLEGIKNGEYVGAMGREKEWMAQCLKSHKAANTTVEQELANGRWLKISERKTPDGSTVGVWGDITELKLAKEAADAANQAKSEFLNIISHELRTPLTAVLGYLPLLKKSEKLPAVQTLSNALNAENIPSKDVRNHLLKIHAEVKEISDRIDTSGQHLLSLINDLLDLSFVESGNMSLRISSLAVRPLLESTSQQFQQAATVKGLTLTCESTGGYILADETRMRQMLINLVGNAIKFTEKGDIKLSSEIDEKYVIFRISDRGQGIPQADIGHIFERFIQSDNSASRQAEGTGLGLAITKKLALLHGGDISVTSTGDTGSTFTLRIPKDRKKGGSDGVHIGG